jgi:DNA-binding response OmpR family regulator
MSEQVVKQATGNSYTIMILDSELNILEALGYILENKGFSPITAQDEDQATSILENLEKPPRLILADVSLYGPYGDEFCKKIKKDPKYSSTSIYLFSGELKCTLKKRVAESGADGYLQKPITKEKFLGKINEIFGEQYNLISVSN